MIINLKREPIDFHLIYESVLYVHEDINKPDSPSLFSHHLMNRLDVVGLEVAKINPTILKINRIYILMIIDGSVTFKEARSRLERLALRDLSAGFLLRIHDLQWKRVQYRKSIKEEL